MSAKDFKARMPKENPEKGKAHVVFSIKHADGGRVEFDGTICAIKATELFIKFIESQKEGNKGN